MPDPEPSLLDQVVALNACATLDVGSVGQILQVVLTVNAEDSTQFFTVYTGRPQAPANRQIAAVELRVAKSGQRSKGEFLLVTLSPDAALRRDEVTQRFGPPPKLDVPTPENSLDYAVRYLYRFNGYPVNFALAPEPSDRVVSIAFDRTG